MAWKRKKEGIKKEKKENSMVISLRLSIQEIVVCMGEQVDIVDGKQRGVNHYCCTHGALSYGYSTRIKLSPKLPRLLKDNGDAAAFCRDARWLEDESGILAWQMYLWSQWKKVKKKKEKKEIKNLKKTLKDARE